MPGNTTEVVITVQQLHVGIADARKPYANQRPPRPQFRHLPRYCFQFSIFHAEGEHDCIVPSAGSFEEQPVNRAVPIPKSRSSSPSIHTAEPRSDQRSGYLAAGFPRNYPSAANSGVASVGSCDPRPVLLFDARIPRKDIREMTPKLAEAEFSCAPRRAPANAARRRES